MLVNCSFELCLKNNNSPVQLVRSLRDNLPTSSSLGLICWKYCWMFVFCKPKATEVIF